MTELWKALSCEVLWSPSWVTSSAENENGEKKYGTQYQCTCVQQICRTYQNLARVQDLGPSPVLGGLTAFIFYTSVYILHKYIIFGNYVDWFRTCFDLWDLVHGSTWPFPILCAELYNSINLCEYLYGCMAFLPILAELWRDFGKAGQVQQLNSGALPEKCASKVSWNSQWHRMMFMNMVTYVAWCSSQRWRFCRCKRDTQRLERDGFSCLSYGRFFSNLKSLLKSLEPYLNSIHWWKLQLQNIQYSQILANLQKNSNRIRALCLEEGTQRWHSVPLQSQVKPDGGKRNTTGIWKRIDKKLSS